MENLTKMDNITKIYGSRRYTASGLAKIYVCDRLVFEDLGF